MRLFSQTSSLWIGGCLLGVMLGVCQSPANAESQAGVEAVAIIEVVAGFNAKYNLGLPYSNMSDCENEISKIGLVFDNLHKQGVIGNKPINILCEPSNRFLIVSPNT